MKEKNQPEIVFKADRHGRFKLNFERKPDKVLIDAYPVKREKGNLFIIQKCVIALWSSYPEATVMVGIPVRSMRSAHYARVRVAKAIPLTLKTATIIVKTQE